MIRNMIFDWSGTLIDDLKSVLAATNRLFTHFGHAEMSLPEFRSKFRLPFREFYAEYLPEVSANELESIYLEQFSHLHDEACLLPGAQRILHFCQQTGRGCYLLSTMESALFEAQSKRLQVRDFFHHAYTRILDKRKKIHELLTTHHLDPNETAFVGDMVHDIEAGRHGGVWTIAILTGFDSQEKLAQATPDVLIQNLDALRAFL